MKLTKPQYKVLKNISEGKEATDHLRGKSEYGGFNNTIDALIRRDLVTRIGWHLTPQGIEALQDAEGKL